MGLLVGQAPEEVEVGRGPVQGVAFMGWGAVFEPRPRAISLCAGFKGRFVSFSFMPKTATFQTVTVLFQLPSVILQLLSGFFWAWVC